MVYNTPGAISYLAFSYTEADQVKALKINGVAPTAKNVENNKWKIWSYEHMYFKKNLVSPVALPLVYMERSKVQKKMVEKLGYISVRDMKVTKDADGNVTKR